jgi:hypothetical protein
LTFFKVFTGFNLAFIWLLQWFNSRNRSKSIWKEGLSGPLHYPFNPFLNSMPI